MERKRVYLTLFLFAIFLISLTSCGKVTVVDNTYKNESLGLSIIGPDGWYLKHSETSLDINVVFSKQEYQGEVPSLGNPAITIQVTKNMPSSFSAEQDIDHVIKTVKEGNTDIKFYENPTKLNINGIEWLRIIYGSKKITQMFYSYFKDKVIYGIIAVAPADEFDGYRPIFEKVVRDIVIK